MFETGTRCDLPVAAGGQLRKRFGRRCNTLAVANGEDRPEDTKRCIELLTLFTRRHIFHSFVKRDNNCDHMRRSEDLRQAVALLSIATGRTAHVKRVADASRADSAEVLLQVEGDKGKTASLRLVPWDAAPLKSGGEACIWILRRGARGLRQQLRERDENFVDLTGAVRLNLPWLMIDRTDLEPVRPQGESKTRNPFSDRGSLILRTMLDAGPERVWSVRDLAETAGISLGLTSYVISALARRHLVEVQTSGRRKLIQLADRTAVIEQWTREYDWRKNTAIAFHASVGSPNRFLRRLPEMLHDRRWALTLQAGASLVAPHASWDLIHLYAGVRDTDQLLEIGQRQGWEPGDGGKVVLMAPFYKAAVWHGSQRIGGLPVVSTLQLILDLWHYPVRGREQAEHLMHMPFTGEWTYD